MKYIIILLCCLLIASMSASATIVIHQVLYDPLGTESGGEAIEIKNIGAEVIDISGWSIRTSTSAVDATIPDTTLLQPEQRYLIADTGMQDDQGSGFAGGQGRSRQHDFVNGRLGELMSAEVGQ